MGTTVKRNNERDSALEENEIHRENSFSNVGNQTLDSIVSVSQSYSSKNKSLMSSLIIMLKKPFHIPNHKDKKQSKSKKNKKPTDPQSSLDHSPSSIIVQDNSILHHSFSKTSNIKQDSDNFIMDLQSDIDVSHATSEPQLKPKISLEIKQKKSQKKDQRKSRKSHLYQKLNVKKIFKKKKPAVFSSVEVIDAEPIPVIQSNNGDVMKITPSKPSDKMEMDKPEQNVDTINNLSTNVQISSVPNAVVESSTGEDHKNETDLSSVGVSQSKIHSFGNISELPLISGIDPTDSLPPLVEENSLPLSTTPSKDNIINFDSMVNEAGGGEEEEEQVVPNNKIEEKVELGRVEESNNSLKNGNTAFSHKPQDTISSNSSSIPELTSESTNSLMQVDGDGGQQPVQSVQPTQSSQSSQSYHSAQTHQSDPSLQFVQPIQSNQPNQTIHSTHSTQSTLHTQSNQSTLHTQPNQPVSTNYPAQNDNHLLFESSEMNRTSTPSPMDSIEPNTATSNDPMNQVILNTSTTTEEFPDDEIRIYCGLPDRNLETVQSVVEKVSQYFADNIACFWSIFPLNEQHQRMGNWKLGEFIDRWFRSGYEECVKEISKMISTEDQFLIERLLKFQLKSCSWTSHNNYLQYNLIRLCMEKDDEQHINILLRYFILPPHLWSRIAYFIAELLEFASSIYPDYDVIVSELTDSYDLVHRMNPIQLCLTAIYMGTNIVPKRKRPTIFRNSINEELYDHEYTLLELMCCLVVENCMKKFCETEIIKYLMRLYAPIVLSLTDSKMYTINIGESQELSTSLIPNYTSTSGLGSDGNMSHSRLGNSDSLQFNIKLMKQHLYQSDPSSDAINSTSIIKIDSNDSTTVNKNNNIINTNNNSNHNHSIGANDEDINISAVDHSHNMSNNLYYNNPYFNQNVTMNQTVSTYNSSGGGGGMSGNPIGIPMYLLHEQNSFDISNHCIDMDGQSVPGDDTSTFTHPSLIPKGNEFEMETISYQANDTLSQSISTTSLTQSTYSSDSRMEQFNKNIVDFYLQKKNEPLMTKASEPLMSKASEPLMTKASEPIVTKSSEPLMSKASKPLMTKASEPIMTKPSETLMSKPSETLMSKPSETLMTKSSEPEMPEQKTPVVKEEEKKFTDTESENQKTPVVGVELEKEPLDSESDDLKTPVVETEKKTPDSESDDQMTPTVINSEKDVNDDYVSFNKKLEGLIPEKIQPVINTNDIMTIATPATVELINEGAVQEINVNKALKGKCDVISRTTCQNDVNDYKIKKEGNSKKTMETADNGKLVMVEPLELVELDKLTKTTENLTLSEKEDDKQEKSKEPKGQTIPSKEDSGKVNDENNNGNPDVSTSFSERHSFRIKDSLSLSSEYSGLRRSTQSINTINTNSHYSRHTLSRNDSEDQLHQYLSRHSIGLYEDMDEISGGMESDFDRNTNYSSLGFINGSNRPPSEAISSFDLSNHCPSFYSYNLRTGSKGKRPMSITASLSSSSSTSSYDEEDDGVDHEYSFVSMLSSKPSLSMKSVLDSTNSKVVLHEFESTHTNSHRNLPRPQGGLIGSVSSVQDLHRGQSYSSAHQIITPSTLQSKEPNSLVVQPSISSLYLDERQPACDSIPSTSQPKETLVNVGSTSNNGPMVPPSRTSSLNPLSNSVNSANPSTSVAATANTTDPLQNQMLNTLSTSVLMGPESSILAILCNNNHEMNRQARLETLHETIRHVNPRLSEKWVKALELVDSYQHHPSLQDTFTDYTMEHLNELEAILRIYHIFNMREVQNDIMGWVDSLVSKN
ncbi:hypothetical protein PIROE2DRAFT_69380 [Piromyces sp. E2]|nr:hypothetical protein PIROE2DRAFT_69380 [Piromyces sp. E2]|eukprot:OUM63456.1 hypothetical protein PIROE2DRAFT_69380 [Piromyces sp. E2]